VFDYIHASLPFISLGTPEVRKIIDKEDVGIIIKDNQPQTIANAIISLSNDSVRYEKIKQNQQAVKQNYTWENETKVLETVQSVKARLIDTLKEYLTRAREMQGKEGN
jgi:glycosyltransferase involved in cell wall biosynthesis